LGRFYNSYFDDLHQVAGNFPTEKDTDYLIIYFTKVISRKLQKLEWCVPQKRVGHEIGKGEINDTVYLITNFTMVVFCKVENIEMCAPQKRVGHELGKGK